MANSPHVHPVRMDASLAVRTHLRPAAHRLLLRLAAMLGLLASAAFQAPLVWAQDDWDAAPKPVQPQAAQGRVFAVPQRDFDQWVYGGMNRSNVEQRLESQLALQVDAAATACGLSDIQMKKLDLAGHADIKKYFQNVERVREKFRDVGQDQQKMQQMWQEIGPLQMKARSGFFDDTSLLQKALKRTLDDDQSARYAEQERERRRFRYEAKIELVVAMMESRMPLRPEQRQRFIKLLLDETQPPKKFGQQDYYVVLYQAAQLDEEKLKSILDDAQWEGLKQALNQAKGMEGFLKSNGFLP